MKKREDKKEKIPEWQKKMEADYLKLGYEKTVKKYSPINFEMWKFLGLLLKKHRQRYKKIGRNFIPI
jgi:hypothetical protein